MTLPRIPARLTALVGALCAAVVLARAPAAQAEGNGFLVGDTARLHLMLEVEPRYDSLAGQGGIGATNDPSIDPADVILHVRPGLKLVAPSPNVDFAGQAKLDWNYYTALLAQTGDLSYLGVELNANLVLGKDGPVGLTLDDTFSRSDRTTNPTLGLGTITDHNTLAARLRVAPGGGAIEGGLGYNFQVESYELSKAANIGCTEDVCNGTKYGQYGSQTHAFSLDARWKFLPKTAIVFDATETLRVYDTQSANVPVSPLRIEGGLAGLLTEKVRFVLKGGYLNTFSSGQVNFVGMIGQAELAFMPIEAASLSAYGQRSVEPVSATYAWYEDWRFGLAGKILIAGRLSLTADGHLDRLAYGDAVGRSDLMGTLEAQAALEIRKELTVSLGTILNTRQSSDDPLFTYNRAEVYLRVTVDY
ncbi:MAG: outer membrane beta-barrel protein [Deltaproteobacteria bacterium]|nr:outer membrane beta-barrel protein [Deltaproteobacteria bacterium]